MYEYPLFEGRPPVPTMEAQQEMDDMGIDLWRVKEVLEEGYDCSTGKRAKNIVEKCLFRKSKEIRIVAALVEWKDGELWRIIHAGKTGRH